MRTEFGVFYESRIRDIERTFEIHMNGKKMLDVGSGEGNVIAYAESVGADAFGVEIDSTLYDKTLLKDKVTNADFETLDFSQFEVIYYYLAGTDKERELVAKIKKEFKGAFIVNHRAVHLDRIHEFMALMGVDDDARYGWCKVYQMGELK